MTSKSNIVIVGCGQIVTHHCGALAACGNMNVIALCDPSTNRRNVIREICTDKNIIESTGSESLVEFDTLDDLVQDDTILERVDIIFIAVPHDLHVLVATKALQTGKHVVMEKPLAPTIETCFELQSIANKSKGMLIVAEQSPYWQEIVKAKELLQQGEIGNLVSASSYYYESMRDNVTSGTDDSGGLGWRCSLERCGGGIVIDGGLHWLRPLRELCGDIERVVGVTQNLEPGLKLEGETLAHALFQIQQTQNNKSSDATTSGSNPLIATYSANMMHTAPMAHDTCPYFRLTGTKGELVVAGTGLFADGGGGLKLYNDDHPTGKDFFPKDRQGGFFLGFEGLWRAVSGIIERNDREAASKSVRDAAADVGVALALYKSSKSGQWEKCELFEK